MEEADHRVPQPAVSQALLVPNARALWRGGHPYFTETYFIISCSESRPSQCTGHLLLLADSSFQKSCILWLFSRVLLFAPLYRNLCLGKTTRNFTVQSFFRDFLLASECVRQIKYYKEEYYLRVKCSGRNGTEGYACPLSLHLDLRGVPRNSRLPQFEKQALLFSGKAMHKML